MSWKPYKPVRYTSNIKYSKYLDIDRKDDLAKLCMSCGYPWGTHIGDDCAKEERSWIIDYRERFNLRPEFFRKMNSKVKVV